MKKILKYNKHVTYLNLEAFCMDTSFVCLILFLGKADSMPPYYIFFILEEKYKM